MICSCAVTLRLLDTALSCQRVSASCLAKRHMYTMLLVQWRVWTVYARAFSHTTPHVPPTAPLASMVAQASFRMAQMKMGLCCTCVTMCDVRMFAGGWNSARRIGTACRPATAQENRKEGEGGMEGKWAPQTQRKTGSRHKVGV